MANTNSHFQDLQSAYIFPIIEKKLLELQKEHPNQKVLNLGIGDVALPLAAPIAEAICQATREMTERPIGYGPCEGYSFLREKIWEEEYADFGIEVEEIFISSGTNPDAAAVQELFDDASTIAIPDPSYPVYRDASLLSGKKIYYLSTTEETGFIPQPPEHPVDLVYLCTPSNPTGVALTKQDMEKWIAWAKKHRAILLIDNVYNAFISSEEVPPSIYALEGGREVAIEMRSFSKSAGFTGLRCSYITVPKTLHLKELHSYWIKRHDITTNGIAYPIQKGALATFSSETKQLLKEQIATYQKASQILRDCLDSMGQTYFGGIDAPYIFWKVPEGMNSFSFFDQLLTQSKIVTIPGSGFGPGGEGFVRLSCFLSETLAKETAHALHHHLCPA